MSGWYGAFILSCCLQVSFCFNTCHEGGVFVSIIINQRKGQLCWFLSHWRSQENCKQIFWSLSTSKTVFRQQSVTSFRKPQGQNATANRTGTLPQERTSNEKNTSTLARPTSPNAYCTTYGTVSCIIKQEDSRERNEKDHGSKTLDSFLTLNKDRRKAPLASCWQGDTVVVIHNHDFVTSQSRNQIQLSKMPLLQQTGLLLPSNSRFQMLIDGIHHCCCLFPLNCSSCCWIA